jgi:ATP-dependent exoDNAse (exonuclease V) beta subunit
VNKAQNNFTVYKSSAGSGKTFTLVKEYLRLALADTGEIPQLYRQILATTFTNKAAAEMKSRIIASLKELSKLHSGSNSTMASELSAELKIDLITLSKRATLILSAILHNYTDFAIGTIDSFTHRIVRAFAHDLRLPVNFEIEADGQKLIAEAIDLLISKIGEDEKLTDILIQFSEANAEEGNSWELEWALKSTATNLLKEEGFDNAKKLLHLSIDDF